MRKIKIAITESQTLFREALAHLIQSEEQFVLAAEADSGESLLKQLRKTGSVPHIVITDLRLPGMDGMKLTRILRQDYPSVRIIILSAVIEQRLISTMISAGIGSYLVKDCRREDLVQTIGDVSANGFCMNACMFQAIQETSKESRRTIKTIADMPSFITKRETEVLQLICHELSNSEIADKLFLSTRTVEGHRNNLLIKTGCKNTAGLVLYAVRHHIVEALLH